MFVYKGREVCYNQNEGSVRAGKGNGIMQENLLASTMASRVTNRLREEIITGKLSEGEHITIKQIADGYQVSHMPVREAFRALEGERLLEIVPYKGAVVRTIDEAFFLDVLDVCDALEEHMTKKAMLRIGPEEIRQLEELNGQIAALQNTPEDLSRHVGLNTAFHSIIFSWAGNDIACQLHSYYHSLASMVRGRYRHSYQRICQVVQEHAAMIDAMRSRDMDALQRALDAHARNARQNLLEQYYQEHEKQK